MGVSTNSFIELPNYGSSMHTSGHSFGSPVSQLASVDLLGFHPHPISDLTPEPWPLSLTIPVAGVEYPDCLNYTEL